MTEKCSRCVSEAPSRRLGEELAFDATYVTFCRSGDYWWRVPLCNDHVHIGLVGGVKTIPIEDEKGNEIQILGVVHQR